VIIELRRGCFSGRWHGDVLIHTYDNQSDAEVMEFLRDVANLSRIRHESVCLFMGACLQRPDYAIVTRFGPLYLVIIIIIITRII